MVGKHQTVIVIFDLESNELEVLGRKKEIQAKGTEGPNMIIYLLINYMHYRCSSILDYSSIIKTLFNR